MAGLVLARTGVPAVIVDEKGGPTRVSWALAVQPRTMEIYDQLGLADRVLAGAYRAVRLQIGDRAPSSGAVGIERVQQGPRVFLASRSSSRAATRSCSRLRSSSLAARSSAIIASSTWLTRPASRTVTWWHYLRVRTGRSGCAPAGASGPTGFLSRPSQPQRPVRRRHRRRGVLGCGRPRPSRRA